MSRLFEPLGPAGNRGSLAHSDTTYHSFHDIELYAPPSPPRDEDQELSEDVPYSTSPQQYKHSRAQRENQRPPTRDPHPSAIEMKRQDSGYESLPPRTSVSPSTRRTSMASSSGSSSHNQSPGRIRQASRPGSSRCRPVITRAAKTSPYPIRRPSMTQVQAFQTARSQSHQLEYRKHSFGHSGYFYFPAHPNDLTHSPPGSLRALHGPPLSSSSSSPRHQHPQLDLEPESPSAIEQIPPQTTHYWTSDRTRRLEYAAIDAAQRGIKGWVRRNLVPDCILPNEQAHVPFDDDTGSVRRYRLELDEEGSGGGIADGEAGRARKGGKKRWSWLKVKSW